MTIEGYIMPLVSKEGLMYLEFIGKPTNEDLATYQLIHITSHHAWDPTMLDATNPYHSLTTDGGECGSPAQASLMASSDPDVIKIHLQSSLCLNLTSMKTFAHSLPLENGEQITKKGSRVLNTNFTLEIQNKNIEQLITYSIDLQILKLKAIIDTKPP